MGDGGGGEEGLTMGSWGTGRWLMLTVGLGPTAPARTVQLGSLSDTQDM